MNYIILLINIVKHAKKSLKIPKG